MYKLLILFAISGNRAPGYRDSDRQGGFAFHHSILIASHKGIMDGQSAAIKLTRQLLLS